MAGPWTVLFVAAIASGQVGSIDFFGYSGLDLEKVRAALPIRVGSPLADKAAVEKAAGHGATASFICCDERGDYYVFIGLEGKTARPVQFNPAPSGDARLPEPGLSVYEKAMDLVIESVRQQAAGDNSRGYALSAYPPLKRVQAAMREYAQRYPGVLRNVLAHSGDRTQRRAAAHLLGYADESTQQIAALAAASRDPDDTVRNNAVRALCVLAQHDPDTARKIPATPFIALLQSTSWTDRNKALLLLSALTASREPTTMAQLRREALDCLIEMAQWSSSYRRNPRLLLGRIAGIEEERLRKLAEADDPAPILDALQALPPL